ncbi:unnamed protein product [Didymodactylos carnosus]|uniref:Uncharacterized protein n=1 Tax=Didymodactylos carnosus TaxID=1234261 RepID=A0A815RD89_9BILA|nr:unnamed protein product [Didymodactylos carnosus]CAF4341747.1 unnamed protein product [Didymodactylos carnosus]
MSVAQNDINKMADYLTQFPHFNAFECIDYDFRSAAHVAAVEGHIEVIRFLSQHCDSSHFERLMNREDRWGLSPMDEAYRHGHFGVCNFVKQHVLAQSDKMHSEMPHLPESESENNTIIHLLRKWKKVFLFGALAASGAAERIDALFARGYFVQTELYTDYDGRTPMHLAAVNGHLNVVQVLIRYRYDGTTYKDRWGNYPVDGARRKKFKKIVDELEQHKA